MPLKSTDTLLRKAQENGYAIGAFNIENMEMAQAVIEAAERLSAPVILQTTPGTLKYAPPKAFSGLVSRLARDTSIPVALHLDHGSSEALCAECIQEGYSSVMIDGSLLPFEENVLLTQSVVMHSSGIPVEAELGTVGGKEDLHEATALYTDPQQAKSFVTRTGISSFAPAIGTCHGIYRAEPKLDIGRLADIRRVVDVPLVLHGTSGVPDEQVQACVQNGICKVNYATELRIVFTRCVRQTLAACPDAYDPKKYLSAGRDAVRKRVTELILLLGSAGKG